MNRNYAGLVRFGRREHIEALFHRGQILLNTFDYFRTLEVAADGRADPDEYLVSHFAGTGMDSMNIRLSANINGESIEFCPTRSGGLVSVSVRCADTQYSHLLCATSFDLDMCVQTGRLLDERNIAEGKDWVLAFKNPREFVHRLKRYCDSQGWASQAKHVNYVSRDDYCGNMGCFKKFDEYSYQNEWRVAIKIPDCAEKKLIELGSLEDVALPPMPAPVLLNSPFELIRR